MSPHTVRRPASARFVPVIVAVAIALCGGFLVLRDTAVARLQAQTAVPACGIGLRLLVVSADGSEVALPAIESALRYLGTPYTVHVATQQPNGLTWSALVDGCRARYNGIILTTANLAYTPDGGDTWLSALTPAEFLALELYERTYDVRQASWFTFPTPDVGFQWGVAVDTTISPVLVRLTAEGQSVFSYINSASTVGIGTGRRRPRQVPAPANPLQIMNATTYLAKPLDASTKPLLVDAAGHALVAVHTYPDGRSNLAMTFDSNPHLLHNLLFSYGVINWVTKGLFIGERRVYMSPQIDDLFIPDSRWTAQTPCTTPVDATGQELRITAADLNAVVAWQNLKRQSPNTANLRLTIAYNGVGAENLRENLTRAARNNESEFYWVNHTYDHENLDAVDATFATWEILENNRVGRELGLSRWNLRNLVTPQVSGLTNPAFLHAAYAAGVRYLVSDTSRLGYSNPSPNAGIYNAIEPRLLMIPRRPNNLFFNVAIPSDWTSEYNCMYEAYWQRLLSYEEILDVESQFLLTYMLQGDMDPWMFHQTNMKVHSASRTLLTDLLDRTLTKYNGYFRLPIESPPMQQIGERMKKRMAFDAAQASATLFPGLLSISAAGNAVVPITGAAVVGADTYGGQRIAHIDVRAGQTVSVTLP